MALKFKQFLSKDFTESLKKLGELIDDPKDLLTFVRARKTIDAEKDITDKIISELRTSYTTDLEKAVAEEDKQKVQVLYNKKQLELEELESTLEPLLDYSIIKKVKMKANDLYNILPILTNLPDELK